MICCLVNFKEKVIISLIYIFAKPLVLMFFLFHPNIMSWTPRPPVKSQQ